MIPDSQSKHENQEIDPHELQVLITRLLGNLVKSLSIESSSQGIVLRGTCDSFYTKQVVQEIVRKNSRVRIVLNALVVDDPQCLVASPEHVDRGFSASQSTGVNDAFVEDRSESAHVHVNDPIRTASDAQRGAVVTLNSFSTIFHPSDFSAASNVAFVHALKIALEGKAMLQMMHVDKNSQANWDDFPSVRETLMRWKVLPQESGIDSLERLGITVSKVIASSQDPVKACIDYFEINHVDLIVLSVHQRDGVMRWLGNVVGERISQGSKQNTLFIPVGQSGFVSQTDGSVKLDHFLIPVVKKPRCESAVRFVQDMISNLNLPPGKVTLLHVGTSETMPFVQYTPTKGWTWNRVRIEGERTEEIVKYAKDIDAKLIVMTTDGPDRFLDGLRGTTSERVLRKSHCPVAVIPVEPVSE